jgi:nitrogen-specific signal transduction histidine kinase
MKTEEPEDPDARIEALNQGIREIAHDLSNPLGVLRMAVYYLETGEPDEEKRMHYYKMMGQTLDKIETGLHRLRALAVPPGSDGANGKMLQ